MFRLDGELRCSLFWGRVCRLCLLVDVHGKLRDLVRRRTFLRNFGDFSFPCGLVGRSFDLGLDWAEDAGIASQSLESGKRGASLIEHKVLEVEAGFFGG